MSYRKFNRNDGYRYDTKGCEYAGWGYTAPTLLELPTHAVSVYANIMKETENKPYIIPSIDVMMQYCDKSVKHPSIYDKNFICQQYYTELQQIAICKMSLLPEYISKSLNDGYYLLGVGKEYDTWFKERESITQKLMDSMHSKKLQKGGTKVGDINKVESSGRFAHQQILQK